MYVDASAMVAVIMREADRNALLEQIAGSRRLESSVVSAFETVLAVGRETGDRTRAYEMVRKFLDETGMIVKGIEPDLLPELAAVHVKYGKGSGHRARLNLGDCFSYAMAKKAGSPLLYVGDDFAHTDLA